MEDTLSGSFYDSIIIGAGASGLLAGRTLAEAGRRIAVLEARDRIGGRIYTLESKKFSAPVELGAEFIHGDLPVTLGLLQEAQLDIAGGEGDTWSFENGSLKKGMSIHEGWEAFEQALKGMEYDLPMQTFIESHFNGPQYEDLRSSVRRFAAGYDTADLSKASTFALREEWFGGGDRQGDSRIAGGYRKLLEFLLSKIEGGGGELFLSNVVDRVLWDKGRVQVMCSDGSVFYGRDVIVSVPVGVLRKRAGPGAISFIPDLPAKLRAIENVGFGAVIKLVLDFQEPFWKEKYPEMESLSFLLSDQEIPTWWTSYPSNTAVLTGWLGGTGAETIFMKEPEVILQKAMESLARIFGKSPEEVRQSLRAHEVVNWAADPFTCGAYSYAAFNSNSALDELNTPEQDTIYFTGEALYKGPAMGTVEAALVAGIETAKRVLASRPQ